MRALAALAVSLVAATGSASAAARTDNDSVTPLIVTPVTQKVVTPVRGSDGRWHILYEIMITNSVSRTATLRAVSIVDGRSGRPIRRLGRKALIATGALHQLDRAPVKSTQIPAGAARLVTLNASFASRSAIPRSVAQRLELRAQNPFTEKLQNFAYGVARIPLSRDLPPLLDAPLDGEGWIASDGCCTPSGHVNATFGLDGKLQAAERFAIDWLRVDPQGRMYNGDPAVLTNWYSYGAPVKAMGPGKVVSAVDGLPDQRPGTKPTELEFGDLPGNVVVVQGAHGLSEVYAHLVPGSVTVKAGDRVQTGQVLGRLGNSGGSLAPHLHMHVVNGAKAGLDDGYPYMLRSFAVAGRTSIDTLVSAPGRGRLPVPRPAGAHRTPRRAPAGLQHRRLQLSGL
jgi:murein DD-endopeptidase MepM/ murein hydrolase activator NlpD